jgi:hypothetical protein
MSVVLKTRDQVLGTATVDGPPLTFEVGQVTAREIVRARVLAEVERYNADDQPCLPHVGLLFAPPEECALNAPRRQRRQPLDAERQVEVALAAVRARRVVVIYNGEQVVDLDAPLFVTPLSEARFLRLVPLAGG